MTRTRTALLVAAMVAALLGPLGLLGVAASPTSAVEATPPVATTAPTVTGDAVWGSVLSTDGGSWDPVTVSRTVRWLRDGRAIKGATRSTYRLATGDLGHRITAEVTATRTDAAGEGAKARAVSEPTARVARAPLANRERPAVVGTARYARTLTARAGRWSTHPDQVRYRWFRGPDPIAGARSARYTLTAADVGRRVGVEVTAYAEGRTPRAARSATVGVRHAVDTRRSVTYSVVTDGRVTADVAEFARLAQETYDDARGWRGAGVSFRRVASGGSFTLVLAEASRLPSYDPICSTMWSCRAGRFVVINQTRWQHASPAWNAARGSLRDYRHMVVNHETGHWLGNGHSDCPRAGAAAPVMMQQSKGLQGCRFNPWPTASELARQ